MGCFYPARFSSCVFVNRVADTHQPTHITPTNTHHTNQHTSHQPTHITPTNTHRTNQHTSHQPTHITPPNTHHTNQHITPTTPITPTNTHHTNQHPSHQPSFAVGNTQESTQEACGHEEGVCSNEDDGVNSLHYEKSPPTPNHVTPCLPRI